MVIRVNLSDRDLFSAKAESSVSYPYVEIRILRGRPGHEEELDQRGLA